MDMPVAVRPFHDALTQSPDSLARLAEQGRKPVGYFCTYTPVELIHACGFVPVRIAGGPGAVEKAYGLAPDFVCPFMKRALEKALAGDYRYLSGVVQGYTCDVACGMVNIWAENIAGELFHSLPIPYNDSPDARNYFRAEINRFAEKSRSVGGRFSPQRLEASLDLYGRIRKQLQTLFSRRAENRLSFSSAELHTVVQAGFVSAPEEYDGMLEELISHLEPVRDSLPSMAGLPVLVSGSLVEDSRVLTTLEALGVRIAADDLCTGYRSIEPMDGSGDAPMDRLMDRYLNRFPCPSRSRAEDRLPLLVQLARQAGARGVIFLLQKFCTPHLADIPMLTMGLKEQGLPVLVLEMDESWRLDGQHRTRLEGFLEMLD